MAALTVWKFETPYGAGAALEKLRALQAQQLIQVQDAAVVSWEMRNKKPRTRQLRDTRVGGALGGGILGLLIGMTFSIPLLGLVLGAASGALFGSLINVGISHSFIRTVKATATPGTSALLLLSSDALVDVVPAGFPGGQAELVSTTLPAAQEARLREAFAHEDRAHQG